MEAFAHKSQKLRERMEGLGIVEADLIEKFVLGSGSGGQKINKTSSCVYLKHEPSGIEIKCQRSRSRERNRSLAREDLCSRIEEKLATQERERQHARELARRRNRKPSRAAKVRMVERKRHKAQKRLARRVSDDD